MPVLRDFECRRGHVLEARREAEARPYCGVCLRPMHSIISLPRPQVPIEGMFPFWHPHLGHRPVQVESWKHYKQLLRAKGKSNELGS